MTAATLDTAERVLAHPRARDLRMKALGGIGCWLHVKEHGADAAAWSREYGDVDLVVPKSSAKGLGDFMREANLDPVESLNANSGAGRRMFVSPDSGVQVDVFIGSFVMCHEVPLPEAAFAPQDHPSLSVTELLLTKLQVIQLSDKDVHDATSLLSFHDVGQGPQAIGADRVAELLSADWGLWRTVTENLGRIRERARSGSVPDRAPNVTERIDELLVRIDRAKKSLRWRTRAKVGERVQWYAEPEEPVKDWVPVR